MNTRNALLLFIGVSIITISIIFIPQLLKGAKKERQNIVEPSYEKDNNNVSEVKEPAVSGTFYPSDPQVLEKMIEGFFLNVKKDKSIEEIHDPIAMILVPHAGYVYSGQTAAYAFNAIEGRDYESVILIGCPHRVAVSGASVYCGRGFRIPFGIISVDNKLAWAIVESSDLISDNEIPHIPEHSLEVELPFLKKVLGDFAIVPILVSGNREMLDRVARAILKAISETYGTSKSILFVISTDLSHYPKEDDALKCDSEILQAFCTLDGDELVKKNNEIMDRGTDNLFCTMCGLHAAYVGIKIANAINANRAYILNRSTSADAGVEGASSEKVVGYGSVVITYTEGNITHRNIQTFDALSKEEQEYLLMIARRSLEEYILKGRVPDINIPEKYQKHLSEKRGVFVTIYKGSELRGCIGNHMPEIPLCECVQRMALESGFNDPRFSPLKEEELDDIRIEISVYLTGVEPIESIEEFEVGKHGIIMQKGSRSATFLPKVPVEQGWDKVTTLKYLCLKAGLEPNAWKDGDTRFAVYETQVFCED